MIRNKNQTLFTSFVRDFYLSELYIYIHGKLHMFHCAAAPQPTLTTAPPPVLFDAYRYCYYYSPVICTENRKPPRVDRRRDVQL